MLDAHAEGRADQSRVSFQEYKMNDIDETGGTNQARGVILKRVTWDVMIGGTAAAALGIRFD